jgi:hypothetical protein
MDDLFSEFVVVVGKRWFVLFGVECVFFLWFFAH